jgi:hypothetical protein
MTTAQRVVALQVLRDQRPEDTRERGFLERPGVVIDLLAAAVEHERGR